MRSQWRPAAVRALACGAACIAISTGCVVGAEAAPGGSSASHPGRHRVDRADRADRAPNEAGLAPVRAAFVAAQQRLVQLESEADGAQRLYVQATAREQAAQQAAASAASQARRSAEFAQAATGLLGRLVAQVYRTGAAMDLSSLTIILDVEDPQRYMTAMHVVRRELVNQVSIVDQAAAASRTAADERIRADQDTEALRVAQSAVAQSAARAQQAEDVAGAQVAALGAQVDALLGGQAQAQAGIGGSYGGPPGVDGADGPPYSDGIAAQALAYASAQLGKPYQWGGIGPGSFDCSGLAMRAYGSAGVALPHFAAFQYQASHPLAYAQLRPGDLLFWATDPADSNTIYHEAMYLGGQKMIQAPKTGWNVMVSDMWMWGPIQFYARPY